MNKFYYTVLITILFCAFAGNGNTGSIHAAVKNKRLAEVKDYVARGDLELPDKNGLTPLLVASYYGHTAIVRYLCEKGARVDADDNKGWTSLMYAAYYNYLEIAKILLDHKADKSIKNPKGLTAFDYANKYGHSDITAMLSPPKQEDKTPKAPVADRQAIQDKRYRVAIFPWINSTGAHMGELNDVILDNIVEIVEGEKYFKLDSSFYKTSQGKNDQNKNLNRLNKSAVWTQKKPDVHNICNYGQELNIDTAILGSYHESGRIYDLKLYLVDIKTSKIFYVVSNSFDGLSSYHGSLQTESSGLIRKLFNLYKNELIQ